MAIAQAEDEDTLAEWVNGEVIMTRPASARHQDRMLQVAIEICLDIGRRLPQPAVR